MCRVFKFEVTESPETPYLLSVCFQPWDHNVSTDFMLWKIKYLVSLSEELVLRFPKLIGGKQENLPGAPKSTPTLMGMPGCGWRLRDRSRLDHRGTVIVSGLTAVLGRMPQS